ncbi:hypothetical protein ACFFRR_010990 [Megaselia abdita]
MKIFVFGFAILAITTAAVIPQNEYIPPSDEVAPPLNEYLAPADDSVTVADDGYRYKAIRKLKYRNKRDVSEVTSEYLPPTEEELPVEEESQDSAVLADDGYQYKTVRRLKYRQRRDVSELASPEYLPPTEEEAVAETVEEPSQDSAVLADDGYQYKTVRRLKYRQRRDVSELASPEYLPPTEEEAVAETVEEPAQDSAVLADDGYQYKTVRRLKYRQRRDVSEIAAPEYLPPTEEEAVAETVEEPSQDSAVLADDGYQYKTVRRLKYRQRRDVSELASPEYLPPTEEEAVAETVEEPAQDSAVLADDGYQYKTVRRLKYRQRRDVSEIAAPEYLPPTEEEAVAETVEKPSQDSAVLADDGYQYKTVRRLKYRQRRDVSELASPEYLPPTEGEAVAETVEEPAQDSAVLADDGYQYKTVRRLKYRQRRDVSELASPEYLPPTEEEAVAETVEEPAQDSAVLADDGYQYKTVRRLKYRSRRDVSELASPEYLPPTEEAVVETVEEPAQDSAVLADDGYQYKTVRRLKYRQRRDVSELASPEYLPPTEEAVAETVEEPAQDSAVLADDGYQYKTVRRLKYRSRRDVSELASPEYLPPTEEEAVAETVEEPAQDSAVLADDGYQYKTVRRLKYRQRRDVSEIAAPEYLPPTEEAVVETVEEPAQDSAVLADDGYQYKTVRRLKYRQRRDVSEIAAPEYLPPTEEAVAETVEEPAQDSAVLADDGYQYKTVRRLKYRQRRDVSEIAAPEYLPPTEEEAVAETVEEPAQDSAVLADDGYQYKTVRRLKYRQRRDVSEIAAPEYLPPTGEAVAETVEEPAQDSAVLADDGYQYKTVRRLKYRSRRDVSEIAAPEYLPPTEEAVAETVEEPSQDSAVLADDGYQYKTVRRLKYRQRRDVSEVVAPEYLPPTEDAETVDSAVLADDGYQYKTVRRLKYKH